MNSECFSNVSAQPSMVAAGAWLSITASLANSNGAMISADASNTSDLLVLVLPSGAATPAAAPSAETQNVWVLKPGESVYGQSFCSSRPVLVGTPSGDQTFQVFPLPSPPPGIARYGGDPVTSYGRRLVAAPANWLTGTGWTAASNPPLPSNIKALMVQYSSGYTCHLEFDGGGLTDISMEGIGAGRVPFFAGIPVTQIYGPAAGQNVTGLIVEF